MLWKIFETVSGRGEMYKKVEKIEGHSHVPLENKLTKTKSRDLKVKNVPLFSFFWIAQHVNQWDTTIR